MTQTKYLAKDATSILDVGMDWAPWLKTDTITLSEWTSDPEVIITTQLNTTTATSCYIGGGVFGKLYKVVNKITTAAGKVDSRYIGIVIEDTSV
jgi:hypothetical protein